MIDMDELSKTLHIAENFLQGNDASYDTLNVNGVPSEQVALAYTTKGAAGETIVPDRGTVKNAMSLNGHTADEFITSDVGEKFTEDRENIKNYYNRELTELRDEMYQMRIELEKNGVLKSYSPYAGFYDSFRSGDIKYLNGICDKTIQDNPLGNQQSIMVSDTFFDKIEPGDHLYIVDPSVSRSAFVRVYEKGADHRTLTLERGLGFTPKKDALIYRSYGTMDAGEFKFGTIEDKSVDKSSAMYFGLSDDTANYMYTLDTPFKGLAYTFRIPQKMQKSYLSKIDIDVQATGSPGSLICYLIEEKNIDAWNATKKSIKAGTAAAEEIDKFIIAKSAPLKISAGGNHIESFDFKNSDISSKNGNYGLNSPDNYPFLSASDEEGYKIRYCAIIEPQNGFDSQNFVNIELVRSASGNDLQSNDKLYLYVKDADTEIVVDSSISGSDLYYGVTVYPGVEKKFLAHNEGCYTANFSQPSDLISTRARLTMRVKREGMYCLKDATVGGLIPDSTVSVDLEKGAGNYAVNLAGAINKDIVIGKNICRVVNVHGELVTLKDGFYIDDAKAPVYPVGYQVTLKAYYDEWDAENHTIVRRYGKKYDMPLVAVMPDKYRREGLSDRLIFETDFRDDNGKVIPYNNFEIEIYWQITNTNGSTAYDAVDGSYPFIGAIHDLSVSLDRTL